MAKVRELNEEYPNIADDDFEVEDDNTPTTYIEWPNNRSLERDLHAIKLKVATEKFVVSLNGAPIFYTDNEACAQHKLWSISKLLINKKKRDENFQYYVKTVGNELQVTCLNKLWMIAYDSIVYSIRYDKIYQCK